MKLFRKIYIFIDLAISLMTHDIDEEIGRFNIKESVTLAWDLAEIITK